MNPYFPETSAPIKLYRNPKSGHCHRVELMMSLLGLPCEIVDLNMANGAHKTPDFRQISPFGLVPVIDDNGTTLSDSNAILTYLTRAYPVAHVWLPEEPASAAEVQRWLSIAAGEIASGPCVARLVTVFGAPLDQTAAIEKSHALFTVMDEHLQSRKFLAGTEITIADVACYTYIAHAPEGGVNLAPYFAILAWLAGVEAQPGFIGMDRSPVAVPPPEPVGPHL
jgi:glutathione S-transferase